MTATNANASAPADVIRLDDDEKVLLPLIRKGDQNAFHRLYERHINKVHGLCFRLTGTRTAAEEACQETFLQVWRKIHTFTGDSSFSTWLHRVATNTSLSYLRKQKNWKESIFSTEDLELNSDELLITEAEPDLGRLDRLLPQLPERARVAFVLHAIEGYRHEDVARTMKVTTGASKAHFHRARTLISQWLDEGL